MKIVKKNIPIYFGKLTIVITKNFRKASEKLKVNNGSLNIDTCSAFVCEDKRGKNPRRDGYMLFIKPNTSPSIIAHEAVHLTNYVFLDTGTDLDRQNDEPQAYLTGWFVRKIHNAINKKK